MQETEQWSVRDDRPYQRPAESSYTWLIPAFVVVLVAGLAGGAYWWQTKGFQGWSLPDDAPAAQAKAEPAPAPAPPPEIRHPLPAPEPEATARPLPALDTSDTMVRHGLVDLMGRKAFAEMVLPVHLIRRVVATVDNLPRPTAPRRVMPLKAVPGAFAAAGSAEAATLDAANFARYAPYVRVLESLDSRALVSSYVRAYPLFQQAYRELGYPKGNFNDRLIEAIDDMLPAPRVDGPIELMRPKVLYEFADPDLETRSAGQKILIRMGADNAARVKAKLREIRRALLAASEPRP